MGSDERPERGAKHEVQVHLQISSFTGGAFVPKSPFAAGMVARLPSYHKTLAGEYGVHCLFHFRSLFEHGLAVGRADVIKINVNRESWNVEHKQVERRASFERPTTLQEWMRV